MNDGPKCAKISQEAKTGFFFFSFFFLMQDILAPITDRLNLVFGQGPALSGTILTPHLLEVVFKAEADEQLNQGTWHTVSFPVGFSNVNV